MIQAIIGINADLIQRRIYAPPGGDALIHTIAHSVLFVVLRLTLSKLYHSNYHGSCTWAGKSCEESSIRMQYTDMGLCYTFSGDKDNIYDIYKSGKAFIPFQVIKLQLSKLSYSCSARSYCMCTSLAHSFIQNVLFGD